MTSSAVPRTAVLPRWPSLLGGVVFVGLREAMSMPYLTLFAVEQVHLAPIALGALLTARAAGAVAFSLLFCAWFDRKPSLGPFRLSILAGAIGYLLLSATTAFPLLLLIVGGPLGVSAAAFPLIFAMNKVQAADADPAKAERGTAILRAGFSAAWGIGPALGAVAVNAEGYRGLFWASSAFSLLACVPLLLRGATMPVVVSGTVRTAASRWPKRPVMFAASSLTLFSMAIGIGAIALPLVITIDLAGDKSLVGIAASVCALLEVPVMAAIAVRPSLFSGYRGMAAGFIALTVYFVTVALATSVLVVVAEQALRAIGIGFVSCLGIGYLQDLMPNRAGVAAALYANTSQIGNLLAGIMAGIWAEAFGYHSLFWSCAALSLVGLAALKLGRRT